MSKNSSKLESPILECKDLYVEVGGKEIIKGISLKINKGEVHALMGRNGSGKTTLSMTLMGHPKYTVTSGEIFLDGENITELAPEERARKRLFLGFQYPVGIPGVTVANFLRSSVRAVRGDEIPAKNLRARIREEIKKLDIPEKFMTRYLNEGFSGGEKKRLEMLQMGLLEPKVAILDEADSGLDIDALKVVSDAINRMRLEERGQPHGILLITHYQRILDYVKPDHVHVMIEGKIAKSGGPSLALELEKQGYEWLMPAGSSTKISSKSPAKTFGEGA